MGMSEAARLHRIRDLPAAIAPGDWSLVAVGDETFVSARTGGGQLLEIAQLHPGASDAERDFILAAPDAVGFLLGLVDRASRRIREMKGDPASRAEGAPAGRGDGRDARSGLPPSADSGEPGRKDYAAEAAMLCGKPAFGVFLEERHGLERPLTPDRVTSRLRSVLGVTSRRELNDGGEAARRWKALRADFEAWRKAGR